MKKTNELSLRQMKDVKGGGMHNLCAMGPREAGGSGGGNGGEKGHCYVDGETIFECVCTNDQQCKNIYGSTAICWV